MLKHYNIIMEILIIQIYGLFDSGKTKLGNKLKEFFKSKIVVKDIDDLIHEFIKIQYGDNFSRDIFDSKLYQFF